MSVDLYPCHTERDLKLYREGKLGVAVSVDVLMQNIQRMVDNPKSYFFEKDLDTVLSNPSSLAGRWYDMGYLPDSGLETLEVTVRGSGTIDQMVQRAQRNLAYKILRRKATHGAGYQIEVSDDSVTLRAIPVVLTRSL